METDFDIYEEYPELRSLQSRRRSTGRKKKKKISNSGKLALLLLIICGFLAVLTLLMSALSAPMHFVYGKDGAVLEVKEDEVKKYLEQGYYENASDLTEITLYASDGSAVTARKGDAAALEKRGYYADKSKVFTTMYSDSGQTVYVPASIAGSYVSKGWHDKLSAVTSVLYKPDGSKITVLKTDAAEYIEKGWTDRLFKAAKKMVNENGEEKIVFNDQVDKYLDSGWTVVKRAIDPSLPMIALTFDDGPGKYTDTLLNYLEKYNSAATFFVVGSNVEKYADTLARADKLGCEIGNHTWDHVNLTAVSAEQGRDSVEKTSEAVKSVIGKPTYIYRPCFGAYNSQVLENMLQPAIMWSIDTLDWKTMNAQSTYDNVINNVYDGAIVLMHDIHQPTVEAMSRLIPKLVEDGWQLVTVSELMEYRLGGMENGKAYYDINDIK